MAQQASLMMDRPIRSSCVPRLLVEETRDARLARQEAVDRARRCEEDRVGLTYPPPPQKRKAGKPSVQAKWEEALSRHIRVHTLLPEGVHRTVRVGWHPGCPLVLPDGAVSLPTRHESEEIIEEPADKKAKRAKINVPVEGIAYYFDYVDNMKALYGWSAQRRDQRIRAPLHADSVEEATQQGGGRGRSGTAWPASKGARCSHVAFHGACATCNCTTGGTECNTEVLVGAAAGGHGNATETVCSLVPTFSQRVQVHVQVEQPKWIGEDDRRCHFQRTEQRQAQGALPPQLAIRHPDPLGPDIYNVVADSQERVVTCKSSAEPCRCDKANITACLVMGTAPSQPAGTREPWLLLLDVCPEHGAR